jgi:hypothetical protein
MDFLALKEKGGNAFPHFRLTYICAIRGSTTEAMLTQRMNPLSGLSVARCAFCFFASIAIATESVRGFTTVPVEESTVTTVSLQPRWS